MHFRRFLRAHPEPPLTSPPPRLTPSPNPVDFPYSDNEARGHSEMGSRDHGMVEFGVQIPMAPFDSLLDNGGLV